jgi:hypothetical protein
MEGKENVLYEVEIRRVTRVTEKGILPFTKDKVVFDEPEVLYRQKFPDLELKDVIAAANGMRW